MATLGKWSGGVIGSLVPTTSWAAPNGLFPTQDRNDSSAYSFTSSTSTVTLPSSGLADGYLIIAAYEFEDGSNGRHNPQGRIVQVSGTGTFVGEPTGGYNRDNSEDRAYVRCWAFVDNPSASSTYQFQWRRDTDSPNGTDGTVRSEFQVIPFFYADIGLYSSTSTTTTGGTTVEQVSGFSGTDGTNITLSSNVVTVTGDNKRYLVLGSQYFDGLASTRTQRWHGLRIDGTKEDAAKGYSYYRQSSDNQDGELFTWLIETATASVTIDQFSYRGDGVAANQGGADVAGATSSTAAGHALVVIELNDSAEVFRGTNTGQSAQSLATAGTRVEVNAVGSALDFNDSASFTRVDAQSVNAEQNMDVLLGANISGAYASTSSARATCYGEFTINGTGQSDTFAGNYGRGNQGTIDTYGWSANLLSFLAVSTGEDIGVNAGKITGGEAGTVSVQPGWAGFWGINLDSLEGSGGTAYSGASSGLRSASRTGDAAGTFEGTASGASSGLRSSSRVGDNTGTFTGAFIAASGGVRSQSRTGDAAGTFEAAFTASANGLRSASGIGSAGATTQAAFQGASSGLRSAARVGDAGTTFAGAFPATGDGLRSASRTGSAAAEFNGAFTASSDGVRSASRVGSAEGTLGQAAESYTGTADGLRAAARLGDAAGTFEAVFTAASDGNRAQSRTGEAAGEFAGAFTASASGVRSASRVGSADAVTGATTFTGSADGLRSQSRTGEAAGEFNGSLVGASDGVRSQARTGSATAAFAGAGQAASSGVRAASRVGEASGAFTQPAVSYSGSADGLRAASGVGDSSGAFTGIFVGEADGLRAAARLGDGAGVYVGTFPGTSGGLRIASRVGDAAGLWVTFRVGRIVEADARQGPAKASIRDTVQVETQDAANAQVGRSVRVSGVR